jgi:NAD(P)-dependent dehydrogenase (short-subunit alcohol dehydrogenase family)
MSVATNSATHDLAGQVALVTGGGRGLGRAFAQALATAGVAVAVTARTETQLDETVRLIEDAGRTVIAFTADVTDHLAMKHVVAEVERQLGPIDVLINNAAVITPLGYDWEVDLDEWWHTLEINVRGPYLCTRLVLPSMMERRQGRIINVSSGAAYNMHPYATAYCASKAALSTMTRLLAAAVKEYGIHAFALSPGGPTAMIETLATSSKVPEHVNARGRRILAEPSDGVEKSVRMLMSLVSGQADALTGRHIDATDSIDDLQRRIDEIVQNDLYILRRCE